MKQKAIIIIAAVVLLSTFIVLIWPAELIIDESWLVVYNNFDKYDSASALWLKEAYNCSLASIYENATLDETLNAEKQSLLFIGGGEEFAGRLPWALTWPSMTIMQSDTQPDVYVNVSAWNNAWVHTPSTDYPIVKNGTFLSDYGYITKAYDGTLQRWIIITVGWSAQCTAAGAKILLYDFQLIQENSWIIYQYTGEPDIPVEAWNTATFAYVIIDKG